MVLRNGCNLFMIASNCLASDTLPNACSDLTDACIGSLHEGSQDWRQTGFAGNELHQGHAGAATAASAGSTTRASSPSDPLSWQRQA